MVILTLLLTACSEAPVPVCDFTVTVVDGAGDPVPGAIVTWNGFQGGACVPTCTIFSGDDEDFATVVVEAPGFQTDEFEPSCDDNEVVLEPIVN